MQRPHPILTRVICACLMGMFVGTGSSLLLFRDLGLRGFHLTTFRFFILSASTHFFVIAFFIVMSQNIIEDMILFIIVTALALTLVSKEPTLSFLMFSAVFMGICLNFYVKRLIDRH
jgi:hypothetical protein